MPTTRVSPEPADRHEHPKLRNDLLTLACRFARGNGNGSRLHRPPQAEDHDCYKVREAAMSFGAPDKTWRALWPAGSYPHTKGRKEQPDAPFVHRSCAHPRFVRAATVFGTLPLGRRSVQGFPWSTTNPFDFFSAMCFLIARRLFCLLRLCQFFRASCFILFSVRLERLEAEKELTRRSELHHRNASKRERLGDHPPPAHAPR